MEKDELIQHALQALRGCLQGDDDLNAKNASISYLGKNQDLVILDGEKLQPYVRTTFFFYYNLLYAAGQNGSGRCHTNGRVNQHQ